MGYRRFLGSLALLVALVLAAGPAGAQNAARGQQIYAQYPWQCSSCHMPNPVNDPFKNKPSGGVKSGVVWQNILFGINSTVDGFTEMTDSLKFQYDGGQITDTDLQDISAYLQNVFGGGGGSGQLRMPGAGAFAAQNVGTQSAAQLFTVSNIGNATVAISAVSNSNASEFVQTAGNCTPTPHNVAAAGSCTLSYAFKPSAAGARSATITITSTGLGSPDR